MLSLIEGTFEALLLILCGFAAVGLVYLAVALTQRLRRPRPTPYVKTRPAVSSWQQSETQRVPRVPHG